MNSGTNEAGVPAADATPRRDRGATFVELLVSIVLLGTIVVAVLVSLQASTTASARDADHARATTFLHDASDAVYETTRLSCTLGEAALISAYQLAIDTNVVPPTGWSGASAQVTRVEFLTSPDPDSAAFTWSSAPTDCREGVTAVGDYTEYPLLSQKVTIVVTAPDGDFTKELETVKAEN